MTRIAFPLFVTLMLTIANSASAQNSASQQDCVAEVAPGAGEEPAVAEAPPAVSDTGKLERCGSVLAPPRTGDGEIVQPAPAAGQTPVVTPEALPEQQPPQPN